MSSDDGLIAGYRHVPLVDLQGEKYIYSTLFVKIKWSMNEIELTHLKPEKRVKATKTKPLRLEEASRSGTSIESNTSIISTPLPIDEEAWMDKETSNLLEVGKMRPVNEAKKL
jgi:hypothetical protein